MKSKSRNWHSVQTSIASYTNIIWTLLNLYFKCINSLHKTIISIKTFFQISICFEFDLLLWWPPEISQINILLLYFSCFYFLVFRCTNYFYIIFLIFFHFRNLMVFWYPRLLKFTSQSYAHYLTCYKTSGSVVEHSNNCFY